MDHDTKEAVAKAAKMDAREEFATEFAALKSDLDQLKKSISQQQATQGTQQQATQQQSPQACGSRCHIFTHLSYGTLIIIYFILIRFKGRQVILLLMKYLKFYRNVGPHLVGSLQKTFQRRPEAGKLKRKAALTLNSFVDRRNVPNDYGHLLWKAQST